MERRIKNLLKEYEKRQKEIKRKLREFENVLKRSEERVFSELCFCLCTPQSRAKICEEVICRLEKNRLLFNGNYNQILNSLKGVRFSKNKAKYIIKAREFFTKNGKLKIKDKIKDKDTWELREWLVKNIKGLGYKEATHFLRNVGLNKNLAILDRHILKNLVEFGIIKEIPKTLTRKKYFEIERKFQEFAEKIKIPLNELDLLFWSKETGEMRK